MPIERVRNRLTAAEREQLDTRGWRDRRPTEWPPVAQDVRPADYAHDLQRGTVAYDPAWTNYSYLRVRVPTGTTITGANFAQAVPRTQAIVVTGGPPNQLTFIECNLINVELHPAWTVVGCNTCQSWIVPKTDTEREGKETRRRIAGHPSEVSLPLTPPPDAITTRPF